MRAKIVYGLFVILCFLSCDSPPQKLLEEANTIYYDAAKAPFYHGVASGDPLHDQVIIWTRVSPATVKAVEVNWTVATDKNMTNTINSGQTTTDESKDYTVKIDVTELSPNTTYYYQFEALGKKSVIGRTKTTAQEKSENVRLAIVSCSNYEAGYFNGFARLAERDDLDAVVHLGDYIYEYGPGTYGDTTLGKNRQHLPAKEIITLSDYRTRYAQYRLDSDFQKVHQQHPFITIWDDHEFANNVYQTGAENHQEEEGDFNTRKAIAKQVYFEWLPVREGATKEIYRTIRFGNLVDLIMLDERVKGRTMPVDSASHVNYAASDRSMLGAEQLAWFKNQLTSSESKWKVIGNQVIFSLMDLSWRDPKRPFNLDAWDGYPYEQAQINKFLAEEQLSNVIFTTGDTHCSWAFEVPRDIAAYRAMGTKQAVAIEFGTPSITSSNFDESVPLEEVQQAEAIFTNENFNPHLKYVNLRDHGYLLLTLDKSEATAAYYYVDKINTRTTMEKLGKQFKVAADSYQLQEIN